MLIEDDIEKLRQELPHIHSNPPHIIHICENEKISIVAADRPDKAVVIGPGGYIAGHLAKKYQKPLSITAYTDEIIKEFRKKESIRLLNSMDVTGEQKEILTALRKLLSGDAHYRDITVAVAMSGGRDSLASAVLVHKLFSVFGLTVYPSDMILPPYVRDAVNESVSKLAIAHQYVTADFSDIIQKSLDGRIHPCGHCHKRMTDILIKECVKMDISAIVFGELLPTGSQSLRLVDGVLVINLPAFLALTKKDTTDIASTVKEYSSYALGCPLLKQVHKKYSAKKYATVKRVFREVRAGVLEPGEALKYVKPLLK